MRIAPWQFWLALAIVGLGYEFWAALNHRQGDTLTENVTALMRNPQIGPWILWTIIGQLLWVTGHFLAKGLKLNWWI
jgi:hypothetical protein